MPRPKGLYAKFTDLRSIALSPEQAAWLEAKANREGTSFSAAVRSAIDEARFQEEG